MIRHQIARILSAVADRIEPVKPRAEIQYVYVHNMPPAMPAPPVSPYWLGPWTSQPSPNICTTVKVDSRDVARTTGGVAGSMSGLPRR